MASPLITAPAPTAASRASVTRWPWLLVPSPETSITRRLVSKAASANSAKEKSIAAPLQGELFVVDAARNVRRQYDGRVDHDRRARRPRPARLRPSEPSNDGGAERNAKSQDAPTSLQGPVGAM